MAKILPQIVGGPPLDKPKDAPAPEPARTSTPSQFREDPDPAPTMQEITLLIEAKRVEHAQKIKRLMEIRHQCAALAGEVRKLEQEAEDILTSFDA